MDAQRVKVLHVTNCDTVVVAVAHYLILYLLPSLQALLNQYLRRERECLLGELDEFLLVVSKTRTESTESISSTDDDRIAKLGSSLTGLLHILASLALDSLNVDFVELLNEELTVLCVHDGLNRSTKHLHVILLENALTIEFNTAVERCLSTEREQDAVGTLLLDNLLNKVRLNRKEIYLVGNTL